MITRNVIVGTAAAFAGLGALGAAALAVNAPDTTPKTVAAAARPAVETQRAVVRTVEDRVKREPAGDRRSHRERHRSHGDRGRSAFSSLATAAATTQPARLVSSGRGEVQVENEAADDRGVHAGDDTPEVADDHGGHAAEAGDDRGGEPGDD